ncbi:zinc transporter 4, chloroplastic-like protein [Corchorus capsularis]|uniref:Zinc transporter 4, chloroplastic-like protein n=1 Tax=Corchorus capsularis TaxID=210143 RepID=A0A1R3H6G5_COCAP|nr:zinc transporter 4, chloroplastic-like protein [Corchorus capsularis]
MEEVKQNLYVLPLRLLEESSGESSSSSNPVDAARAWLEFERASFLEARARLKFERASFLDSNYSKKQQAKKKRKN